MSSCAVLDSAGQSDRKELHEDFAAKVKNQIRAGINRRDDEKLKDLFERTIKKSGTQGLSTRQFASALEEVGVHLKEDEIKSLFHTMDVNNDEVMDFEEFKKAVQSPSAIEQLISTLPINNSWCWSGWRRRSISLQFRLSVCKCQLTCTPCLQ
jgi:hypothetical protein